MPNPTVFFAALERVVIEDRPRPIPAAGQLLVATSRTLISTGTELSMLCGEAPPDSVWAQLKPPIVPGYNNIGRVIEVGPGVDSSWIGKRIASYQAHAQYVTASPNPQRIVPEAVSDDEAVFFTLAEIVMNGIRRGKITWGESVVIFGAGLLGQLAARICRLAGARPVIVVDRYASRLSFLPEDNAILKSHEPMPAVVEMVRQATQGRMADCVIELTGNAELIPQEFAVLRRQGRFVVLSSPREPTMFDFHDLCNATSVTIIGAHNDSHPERETLQTPWTQPRHAELFFNWLAAGEMHPASLISHRRPYQDAPELYRMLIKDRSQAMGVVLEWTK